MFRNILVALDGTSTSQRALDTAVRLASDQNAVLHLVHVVEDIVMIPADGLSVPADYLESMAEGLRESGRAILDKAQSFAGARGIGVKTTLVDARGMGVAPRLLREATRRKADLIVLGTHGRRGLRRLLMGSDAEAVLREARVPVLLVRAPERARVTRPVALPKLAARPRPRRASPRKQKSGAAAKPSI